MRVGPLRPNRGGGGAAFAHCALWSSPAAWCGWRGSSLCTAAPHGKSWDVTRKELSIWDHKGIFCPGKFPLLPRSSPALCFSLLPSSRQAGRWARAEHPGWFGHMGQACGLRLVAAVPRRCSARCLAGATVVAPPSKSHAKFKHCLLA